MRGCFAQIYENPDSEAARSIVCGDRSTIRLAVAAKNVIAMWGPYEIERDGFDLGVKRMRLLDAGTILYRADDRVSRKDKSAINCFHAMSDLDNLFPAGGLFGTGLKMWGINGTARVLI